MMMILTDTWNKSSETGIGFTTTRDNMHFLPKPRKMKSETVCVPMFNKNILREGSNQKRCCKRVHGGLDLRCLTRWYKEEEEEVEEEEEEEEEKEEEGEEEEEEEEQNEWGEGEEVEQEEEEEEEPEDGSYVPNYNLGFVVCCFFFYYTK